MQNPDQATSIVDHRPKVALKKRQIMRGKLLDAAMRVFAVSGATAPVIDDVIHEANVSRGTFYNYFNSLDEVLIAIGQELNNQMTTDILPVYDVLTQPRQRVAVAFRLFMVRALLDPQWAGFVTRVDAWPHTTLVAEYMARDLQNGHDSGDFRIDLIDAATDFLMGASAHGIQAIRQGVDSPNRYMNASVRMMLSSLGCNAQACDEGVAFSVTYLRSWANGELTATRPAWAMDMDSDGARQLLAYD